MINIHLFNGAKTKDAWDENSPEFIDGWKPESRDIVADDIQITYRDHIKIYHSNDRVVDLFWSEDGYIELDGVFYGDVSIQALRD